MRRSHVASKSEFNGNLAKNTIVNSNELNSSLQKQIKRKGKKVTASTMDVRMDSPTFYHPLFQSTNMLLPRDRRERNEWCRHFYRTEPIIGSSIDLHTEFPISGINNICSDTYIKKFFDYMAFDKLDLVGLLLDIGLEYWKIGDVFPMGQFNESTGAWEKFTLLNPDYINIEASIFAQDQQIELIPDDTTVSIVAGGPGGKLGDLYRQMPEDVIMQVKQGKNISLDDRLVSHIAHKASRYEVWGTPLMMRCFKTLIYKDKLRQAQDAVANRHIFPIRVAKIGAAGEPYPTQEDLDAFRDVLLEGAGDPNFFLVYHYGLSFEYVGSSSALLPLAGEFEWTTNELMTALSITPALLQGDGTMFAGGAEQPGFDLLNKRYMAYRHRLEEWVINKVYKPVAQVQGFYRPNKNATLSSRHMSPKELKRAASNKEMDLIIPQLLFAHQDITSNSQVMSFIQSLTDKGMISLTSVLPILSLDPQTEKRNLERERGTVFDQNAPKQGPLTGATREMTTDFTTGYTVREYDGGVNMREGEEGEQMQTGETSPSMPLPPNSSQGNLRDESPSVGNNPADYGMPDKYVRTNLNNDLIKRHSGIKIKHK